MNKNLSNSEMKRAALEIIAQVGLQSQKPERKAEIANILQIDLAYNASPAYFKDQIADWVVNNYQDLKNNLNDFFQNGNLKSLSKESKDILTKLIKKITKRVNELQTILSIQLGANSMLKNTYMGYPPHMNYVYPPGPSYMMPPTPNTMGGNYSEEKQNFDNYMQQYYMQFTKFGGYPMSQYYMPQMPSMELSKYPDNQPPETMKNPPYYPYQMQPPTHPQPYAGYPIHHPSMYMPPPILAPPSATSLQSNSAPQKPPKNKQVQDTNNKQSKQNINSRLVDENQQIFKKYQQTHGKQLPKNAPFLIVPPSMQKNNRQQIPEQISKNGVETLNNESSEILIVEKNPQTINQMSKDKTKKKKIVVNKNKSSYPEVPTRTNSENTKPGNFHMILNRECKQQFQNCTCKGYGISNQFYTCNQCKKNYHYACTSKKINPTNLNCENEKKQICHFCFMMDLDPLNKVEATVKTSYLIDIRQNKFHQYFDFEAFDSFIIKNSPYQIELRCMRMEDAANGVSEYTWPDECLILLNEDKAFEFQALQHNSSLKKRKDMSIFLTSYIYQYTKHYSQRKNLSISLQIKQSTTSEHNQKKIRNGYVFIFGVYLTKKKTPDQLCEQIMNDPNSKVSFALQSFSQPSEEEDVQIQQIKVNLLDPFTWNLIYIPARGKKCNHGQCFDLKTFLSFMNVQKVRQWKCPVCNKQCRHFFVDAQQLQAIKEFVKQQSSGGTQKLSRQISFHRDGRTLFVLQNDQDEGEDDRNANIIDPGKIKKIAKDQKQSL